jgi:hypothetical protein
LNIRARIFDRSRIPDLFAVILMLIGAWLRARHYFTVRSLWLDEAMLGLNIAGRSYAELLAPLEMNQAAPCGVLVLMKTATLAMGNTEWALRLFPFLASLASLPLFFFLVRSLLSSRAACFALFLLALSPTTLVYAGEAKQYTFDLLATILVLQAVEFYCRETRPRLSLVLLATAGSITLLFSYAVAFVTFSAGIALLGREVWLRGWPGVRALMPAALFVLSVAVADYFLLLRPVFQNDYLASYWEGSLSLGQDGWTESLSEGVENLVDLFETLSGLHTYRIGIGALLLGAIGWSWKGKAHWTVILVLPPVLALIAAILNVYPFSERLLLFLLPLLALAIASGVEFLLQSPRRWIYGAGWALAYLLFGETLRHFDGERETWKPHMIQQMRPVLSAMEERIEDGDLIYVDGWAMPSFRFYTECTADYPVLRIPRKIYGEHQGRNHASRLERFYQFHDYPRVWTLFVRFRSGQKAMVELMSTRGTERDRWVENGARAFLFELTPELFEPMDLDSPPEHDG